MQKTQGYRRDIDGLRAIAIIPVVLFHLSLRYTPGGFIGVDIFFVISGYLLSQHIFAEMKAGTFSITRFYERRIRRIFPAAFVMMAIASVFAYLFLLPSELRDFAWTLVTAVTSVSNIYFWLHTNYFEISDKPLLHTWSLATEEQFYVVLPLLLMLLRRHQWSFMRAGLLCVTAASFVASALTVHQHQSAAFYLLPQRAWEMLVGSILALRLLPLPKSRVVRELLSGLGLVAILTLVCHFPANWTFPGVAALIPCLGAAAIIAAGEGSLTLTSRLLSIKPLVGVGLISYSLYLWHLPLIIFQSYAPNLAFEGGLVRFLPFLSLPQAITVERDTTLLAVSLLLGYLSWKFVEQPIRFGRLRPGRGTLFAGYALASLILIGAGIFALQADGLPQRFDPRVVKIESYNEKTAHYREGTCFVAAMEQYDAADCLHESTSKPNWLLLGDSHAAHLAFGLSAAFPSVNIMQWTIHGCKPMPIGHYGENPICTKSVEKLYREYLPRHHLDGIILSANWQIYDLPRLSAALETLASMHQHVLLIGPIMHYDAPLRRLLSEEVKSGNFQLAAEHRILTYDDLDRTMEDRASHEWKVEYFSYLQTFCPSSHCMEWSAPDVPLQWDQSHLLDGGSLLVGEAIRKQNLIPAK